MKKKIVIQKIEVSVWDDDRGFRCGYKYSPSMFGDYSWFISDKATGKGSGGFAPTAEAAEAAASQEIEKVLAEKP